MKNKIKKGMTVVLEDDDETVKVLDCQQVTIKPGRGARPYKAWEYRVKNSAGMKYWVPEHRVLAIVRYQPAILKDAVRHAELCQELFSYEQVRDYLETLKPATKADKVALRTLKELVENVALTLEGNSAEAHDAQREIEELMR
jgi:hypothetical protein